jgi:hypothetical protein
MQECLVTITHLSILDKIKSEAPLWVIAGAKILGNLMPEE